MARGTVSFLFLLTVVAVFFWGIKLGMKLEKDKTATLAEISATPTLTSPTSIPSDIPIPTTVEASVSADIKITTKAGTSTYINRSCGFSFSYPGSYLNQKSVNEQSIIMTDPTDVKKAIATTCAVQIP